MPSTPSRSRRGSGPLLVRLHFYAGVLVAPFLAVAALTGLLYTVAPQVDAVAHGDVLSVEQVGTAPRPLAEQVAAAQAVLPDLGVTAVDVPEDRSATTRVTFADPVLTDDRARTVYVDPYTAQVQGELVTWFGYTPTMTWLDDLHRNLHLGTVGRHYSELAASWLWVLVVGGLLLWVRRQRASRRRLVVPDLTATGRRRTVSWHAATGTTMVVVLLFLSATGLTWSRYAGERFTAVLTALDATAPELDTSLTAGAADDAGHAGHDSGTGAAGGLAEVDRVLDVARGAGLSGPVALTPPSEGTAWTVAQTDSRWPVRKDQVAVDAAAGRVTARADFADRPVMSKLSAWGTDAHMGLLFGPLNQVLLALTALGVLCSIVWGYRAWWQRRPRHARVGRLPQRGVWRDLHPAALGALLVVTAAVGWAVPLLGLSLLAFLVVDLLLGLRARRVPPGTPPEPGPSAPHRADQVEELLV